MVLPRIPEFGTVRENEERRDGGSAVVFDPALGLFAVAKERERGTFLLFSGGLEDGEEIREGILREVREESGLYDFAHVEFVAEALAHYHNDLKRVNRIAHTRCFLVILQSRAARATQLEEHEKFDLAWATAREIIDNWNERNADHNLDHWIYFFDIAQKHITDLGYAIQ